MVPWRLVFIAFIIPAIQRILERQNSSLSGRTKMECGRSLGRSASITIPSQSESDCRVFKGGWATHSFSLFDGVVADGTSTRAGRVPYLNLRTYSLTAQNQRRRRGTT